MRPRWTWTPPFLAATVLRKVCKEQQERARLEERLVQFEAMLSSAKVNMAAEADV